VIEPACRVAKTPRDIPHPDEREHGQKLGLQHCAVFGSGNNDRLLLKAAKEMSGVAVVVENSVRVRLMHS
jgi:hypothetical protein